MQKPPKPKPSRAWRIALVVSLGLNLLVFGLAIGAVIGGNVGPGMRPPVELSLGPISRALSDDDRRALRRELGRQLAQRGVAEPDDSASLEALVAAVRTDPFEPEAVRDVLERQMQRAMSAGDAGREAFIARLEGKSPEEREAFAERLESETRRRPGPPSFGPGPRDD
ncbi:periplasmic heavy metal sensor [Pseudoroseicyclus sp. H15]